MTLQCVIANCVVSLNPTGMLTTGCFGEGQDLPCTHLAHHDLESVKIKIIITVTNAAEVMEYILLPQQPMIALVDLQLVQGWRGLCR